MSTTITFYISSSSIASKQTQATMAHETLRIYASLTPLFLMVLCSICGSASCLPAIVHACRHGETDDATLNPNARDMRARSGTSSNATCEGSPLWSPYRPLIQQLQIKKLLMQQA